MKPFGSGLAFLVLAAGVTATGVALVAPAAPLSAQEKPKASAILDTVVYTDGSKSITRKDGKIESADYNQVEYVAGGKKTSIPAGDVIEVRWGDDPSGDYDKGLRAILSRDADAARSQFDKVVLARTALPDLRSWVEDFANCGLGEANLLYPATDAKAADRAAEAFAKAKTANPKSFVLDRILKGLAQAEARRRKPADASKALDELIVAAKAAKRTTWEIDAHFAKAQIQLESGNTAGAITAFDDAIRFAESAITGERSDAVKTRLRGVGIEAAVGKGWAMVAKAEADKAQAGFDAAKSYFDGLASKHPADSTVLAALANAEGRAKLASGDARAAQRIFARAEVMYFQAHTEVARSLWYQAECWKALGDEKTRAERLTELKTQFPSSEWARKAD